MAFKFSLVRPSDGAARPGYFGFAWTTLLFGPLASIGRKDFSIAFLTMALEVIFCLLVFWFYDHDGYLLAARLAIVTFCWALLYNEIHALNLLVEGFRFHGPDEVVAALNDKFSATGRAERLRLLQARSLLFVAAGLGILQISTYLLSTADNPAQTPPSVAVPAPAPVAPPSVITTSPAVEAANRAAPKELAGRTIEKKESSAKSGAEEQQRQCDVAMGNQFDPDLPRSIAPVVMTSVLSEAEINQAIANCEAARRGNGRRFNSQLGRAYAAKAVLLATQGKDREGEARANMDKAVRYWITAKDQGSSSAMNSLGAYYGGIFNSSRLTFSLVNFPAALDYWRAGAAAGNPKAARNAGAVLLVGPPDYPDVTQDGPAAKRLLENAINGGDVTAKSILGEALYSGNKKGVSKETPRGLGLLAQACTEGDQVAKDFYDEMDRKRQNLARPPGC